MKYQKDKIKRIVENNHTYPVNLTLFKFVIIVEHAHGCSHFNLTMLPCLAKFASGDIADLVTVSRVGRRNTNWFDINLWIGWERRQKRPRTHFSRAVHLFDDRKRRFAAWTFMWMMLIEKIFDSGMHGRCDGPTAAQDHFDIGQIACFKGFWLDKAQQLRWVEHQFRGANRFNNWCPRFFFLNVDQTDRNRSAEHHQNRTAQHIQIEVNLNFNWSLWALVWLSAR